MGRAARDGLRRRTMLENLKVAVDVQHLYKFDKPHDQGSVFHVGGLTWTEAHAATLYAQGLTAWLTARGAQVLVNDPAHGILVGPYGRRQRAAMAWGAHAYLACHVNAGGGDYARCEVMRVEPGTPQSPLADMIVSRLTQPDGKALLGISGGNVRAMVRGDRGPICVESFVIGPAVLLEPFFGDQPAAARMFAAPALQRLGELIGEGLGAWWQAIQPAALGTVATGPA